jgi:ribosomal protein S17E
MKNNKPTGKLTLEQLNRIAGYIVRMAAEMDNLNNGLRNCHKAAGVK